MIYNKWFYVCCQHFFFVLKICWKTILKKTGIILLSTLLFALCSGLLYITKMAGSIHITRPEDEPELASAMTNENLDTETREKLGGYWTIAVFGVDSRNGKLGKDNNADVQMLCSINRDTGELRLVSLYRDTLLMNDTANNGYGKLNQSYFLQGPSGNISAINTNLDMKAEDFVSFNWNSAADAINLLGGVDIELSRAEFCSGKVQDISSGQLLYDVEEGAHFDLLLLDIEMPEKDGMCLAASLRRHLPMALIIFITSHTQYAVKAYELSVFRYIPKSEMETCLPLGLNRASATAREYGGQLTYGYDGGVFTASISFLGGVNGKAK